MKALTWSVILFALLVAAYACAPAPTPTPVAAPTEIVYPATWTPETTPVPPTFTPLPPTPTRDAVTEQVQRSFERTSRLEAYHALLEVNVTDPLGTLPGSAPGKPFMLFSLEGRENQGDSESTLRGLAVGMLGGDADKGIRIVAIGKQLYLRGPAPFLGASQDRWYVSELTQSEDVNAATKPNGLLANFADAPGGLPQMRAAATDSLDNKSCTVYRGDEQQTAKLFAALDRSGFLGDAIGKQGIQPTRATMNVWICEDGYVHKLDMSIETDVKGDGKQVVAYGFSIRLDDLNILVPILAPEDAIPMPSPFSFPTPSFIPTPQTS